MPRFMVPLSAPDPPPLALVGGKAANLAVLKAAGFPVPEGFVLTTEAFRSCAGSEFAPEWLALITDAYQQIGPGPVVVRSSATAEDLPGSSFAGQYETVLNVASAGELLTAIHRCWASLDSGRALAYRQQFDPRQGAPAMAVLVQRMVPAELSGVLFTANPVANDRGEMLLNVAHGLGEALVSGQVTPDEHLVDRASGAIHSRPAGRASLLGHEQIRELCRLGQRIEALFGSPQDIEWAWAEGRFHILQSRPITTLSPLPQVLWGHPANEAFSRERTVFWSNWNTRENMPHALKPLAWSCFADITIPAFMEAMWSITAASPLYPCSFLIDLVNGRAYWNMSMVAGHPLMGRLMLPKLRLIDQEAGEAFERLLAEGTFRPVRHPLPWRNLILPMFKAGWSFLRCPWLASGKALRARSEAYWNQAETFEAAPLDGKSIPELLQDARRFVAITCRAMFPILFVSGRSLFGAVAIQRMTRSWPDLPSGDLMAALPGNKTVETALELYRLSRMPPSIRAIYLDPGITNVESALRDLPEGPAFLARLAEFLEAHGHRGTKDLDMGHPSWKEDPSFIHQTLRSYLSPGPQDWDPERQFQSAVTRRETLAKDIERRLSQSWPDRLFPIRRWWFRRMHALVIGSFPWRENFKFYGMKMLPICRRIMAEIGRRFRECGYLQEAEEIWFLTVAEIERQDRDGYLSAEAIRSLVTVRRARWHAQQSQEAPLIIRSDGRPVAGLGTPPAHQEGHRLTGFAASRGSVTGIARVIRDPSEGHRLNKGEILVAPTTEPGWAPLFLLAGGLVMDVGGAVCHGAIVAREYGIPAVVGVRGATGVIVDGERITVDGTGGRVILHRDVDRRPEVP